MIGLLEKDGLFAVVLSASSDAFLSVVSTLDLGHFRVGIYSAKDDGLVLVKNVRESLDQDKDEGTQLDSFRRW
jgi:hypothetical protein